MNWPLKIQGRWLSESDVGEIENLLRLHPDWGRTKLSKELCRHWDWRRPDGLYKDIACREMLVKLEKLSLITLPPRRTTGPQRPPTIEEVQVDQSLLHQEFKAIKPVCVVHARHSKSDEKLFNYLMKSFHYLSFGRPAGQNMKYLFFDHEHRVLGGALFGAAAWKVEHRDQWIGWDVETRERNLHLICNNTRFLILPWIRVPHLASHVLGVCLRRLASDWMNRYGTAVVLVETFVDTTRFQGTCYKAANWHYIGKTKGRSRQDRSRTMKVPIKDIWIFTLQRNFRKVLMQ